MKKTTSPTSPHAKTGAKVGVSLATQVACQLENSAILAHTHRDYCGIGLRCDDGEYVCGEVFDGTLPSAKEFRNWQESAHAEWKTFNSRAHFVAWLAEQSDESLSGKHLPQAFYHDNQRLTIQTLQEFVNGRSE